jgi:hypothetical protein
MQERTQSAQTAEVDGQKAPTAEHEPGPGEQALAALVRAGAPEPAQVVAIIDAHRGERDALFALLHSTLGNAYVQRVVTAMSHLRASVERREVVGGDPSDPNGGYFIASQADKGARWRTADGRFTGTADQRGLDSRYRLDDHDAIHAHVGADRTGSLAFERDGRSQGELYGAYRDRSDMEIGARRTWDVDGGALTAGVRHQVTGAGSTDGAFASYRNADGSTTADGALGVQAGKPAGTASMTRRLSPHDTVSGSIAHDAAGTRETLSARHTFDGGSSVGADLQHTAAATTGSVSGTYKDQATQIDGSLSRGLDRSTLQLAASHQFSPELSASGHLTHERPDHGSSQTTLGISERYRSRDVIQSFDLNAGDGARDFVSSTGSIEARLGQSMYGGAWGTVGVEQGKHSSAQIGASLTFTPSEKTALTLAGVIDQDGTLETRLQLDVFKTKISSLSDLSDHKKDALVSLFISYSQGGHTPGGQSMLGDRFGTPQFGGSRDVGSGQVMGGIRIKF